MITTLHVLFVFIWVGNLLALSRFMGYHVKEDAETQLRLGRLYKRIYYFVGMPSGILAVTFGLISLVQVDLSYKPGWFHMKILFIVAMIVVDVFMGSFVRQLDQKPDTSKGIRYKIIHGVIGLCLIGILTSLFYVRDRDGEVLHRHLEQQKRISEQNLSEKS